MSGPSPTDAARPPAPTRDDVLALAERYVCPDRVRTFAALGAGIVMGRREGYRIHDVDGRSWLDLHLNGGVFNLGHRNPELIAVLVDALDSARHRQPPLPQRRAVAARRRPRRAHPRDGLRGLRQRRRRGRRSGDQVRPPRHRTPPGRVRGRRLPRSHGAGPGRWGPRGGRGVPVHRRGRRVPPGPVQRPTRRSSRRWPPHPPPRSSSRRSPPPSASPPPPPTTSPASASSATGTAPSTSLMRCRQGWAGRDPCGRCSAPASPRTSWSPARACPAGSTRSPRPCSPHVPAPGWRTTAGRTSPPSAAPSWAAGWPAPSCRSRPDRRPPRASTP